MAKQSKEPRKVTRVLVEIEYERGSKSFTLRKEKASSAGVPQSLLDEAAAVLSDTHDEAAIEKTIREKTEHAGDGWGSDNATVRGPRS